MELHQMPKRSQCDDLAKAMIGGKPKSSDTGASKGKGKGRGKPINIPLDNISPELKKNSCKRNGQRWEGKSC